MEPPDMHMGPRSGSNELFTLTPDGRWYEKAIRMKRRGG